MPASKSANLCWGQRYHWLRYHHVPSGSRHEAHITDSFPLPEGLSFGALRSVLQHVVRRHEVLRTVYDADAHPSPQQRVQPPAPITLHRVTSEQDGTPSPAEALRDLLATDFDMAREWPMRACVITTGGVPRRLHLVFNHVAFDDVSLGLLRQEFEAMLGGVMTHRPASLPPVPYQPWDLARHESALPAAGTREVLAHWRGEVERLPADVYAGRRVRTDAEPAAHSASFTSPSLLTAAREIADRGRVWPSAVHLAAYAVTTAAYTGERLIAHRMYTSQREAGGHPSIMACMSSPTLVTVDLRDDPPFSEVLHRTAAQVEQSLARAHVPYDELVELVSRESSRRGRPMRIASELNFLGSSPRSCGTRRDRFARNPAPVDWTHSGSDTYFRVYEWQDGVTLALQAMAAVMDAEAVEGILRGYARLLEAHRDPAADLRTGEAARLMEFGPAAPRALVRLGPDAVDPRGTEAALLEHPAVRSVRVEVTGRGLVAEVVAEGPLTPAELRTHSLGAMYRHPAASCPDWFRITDGTGTAPSAGAEGDGRTPAAPREPGGEAERVLADAVAEVNGLGPLDPSDSYTLAGGRVLRVPRVLAVLRERGWTGITVDDFTTARPLRALAGLMAPAR